MKQPQFLPMSKPEMHALGWQELDILLVTGDAYVDHPSFGAAIIGRYLVSQGFRVGIIAQPDWKSPDSVSILGRPKLFAGVTAGAMDSMVSNYTANKKLRRDDAYSPGNRYGLRPNRASIVYTNLLKQTFPKLPIVLGGIEASMRRLVHYDYWDNKIRRSLILDSKADILVYGMGEKAVAKIAERLKAGNNLSDIPGTVIAQSQLPETNHIALPSYEEILKSKELLINAALVAEVEHATPRGKPLVQAHKERYVVIAPPSPPLTTSEIDALYNLPFSKQAHPHYREQIPALAPVINSIITHRGCYGGCTFCVLGAHQGKIIQSRSRASIIKEINQLIKLKTFHGTITDLGGPSANMYQTGCSKPSLNCQRASCLYPTICRHLKTDHHTQLKLLSAVKKIPGIKHAFIASGIRYDLANADKKYLPHLLKNNHISGTLKIAPEHINARVLNLMRKPHVKVLEKFLTEYQRECQKNQKPFNITTYFIASFPGSTPDSMKEIYLFAKENKLRIEQMQDFIPLPMTLAGIMYYTGLNPWNKQPLKIAQTAASRKQQRRMLLSKYTPSPNKSKKYKKGK